MSGIKVKLSYDEFDMALVEDLKSQVKDSLENPWVQHHNYSETLKDVDSFLRVIQHYQIQREFEQYFESIKPLYNSLVDLAFPKQKNLDGYDIKVFNIRDMPDGSGMIEFEASDKMKELLMQIGLNKILKDEADRILIEKEC